ncbi:MAG: CvpA family protein [Flavobacteriales bacterium]|nr:CvpA family protein [Flavobacteriales bacterium]
MNWLDWTIIALVAYAAIKGFSRGLIVELASLVALVAGAWVALHFSDRVVEAIGLGTKNAAIAFLVTFILVVVAVHFLARSLTTLIDIAQLGLPNKVGGLFLGALRSAFVLSIALNLLAGRSGDTLPPKEAREASVLHGPVRAFAPLIVPALNGTKWMERALEEIRQGVDGLPS